MRKISALVARLPAKAKSRFVGHESSPPCVCEFILGSSKIEHG